MSAAGVRRGGIYLNELLFNFKTRALHYPQSHSTYRLWWTPWNMEIYAVLPRIYTLLLSDDTRLYSRFRRNSFRKYSVKKCIYPIKMYECREQTFQGMILHDIKKMKLLSSVFAFQCFLHWHFFYFSWCGCPEYRGESYGIDRMATSQSFYFEVRSAVTPEIKCLFLRIFRI